MTRIGTGKGKRFVHICFYVKKEEYKWLQHKARWLYDQNGVESVFPSAKAATFKLYNEVNEAQRRIAEQLF
jgi:hypothetical protein